MTTFAGLAALLELVQMSGGTVLSRIRLQKEAYLLAAVGVSAFRRQSFGYHHYGPFSRELSDTLQFAVSAGLLNEIRESFSENNQRYKYELTDAGRSFIAQSESVLEAFGSTVNRLSSEHWRALELASTVDFLQRTRPSNSLEKAFDRALQLKPETGPYRKDAERLLKELST
jgi:uncharacterized protein